MFSQPLACDVTEQLIGKVNTDNNNNNNNNNNNKSKITIMPCVFPAACQWCHSATRRQTSSSPESYQAAACETTRLRFRITFMLTTDAGIQMKNRVWSH